MLGSHGSAQGFLPAPWSPAVPCQEKRCLGMYGVTHLCPQIPRAQKPRSCCKAHPGRSQCTPRTVQSCGDQLGMFQQLTETRSNTQLTDINTGQVWYESNVHPAARMAAAVIPGHRRPAPLLPPRVGEPRAVPRQCRQGHTAPAPDPRARQARAPGSTRGGDGCQGAAASPRKWMEITGTRCPQPEARPLAGSRGRCQRGDSPARGSDILLPLKASHLRVLKCWTPAF